MQTRKLKKSFQNMSDYQLLPRVFKNPPEALEKLRSELESYWQNRGDDRALELFYEVSSRVPAYQKFLKKHKINPEKIKSIGDFSQIPPVSKDNYLRQYPLKELMWDGTLKDKRLTISSTSGSTGEPFYFPRETGQDEQYASLAEMYMLTNFDIANKSTLYIIGFPLGPWIGGIFTYRAIKMVAERGQYALSVATPGVSSAEIIKTVKKLGGEFDQVIIGSYGPFLKDALDEGERVGLDWKKYNCKFVFSAEVFSEGFRDYVIKKAGLKNPYKDTLNHYGTVDLGTMSYETPLAVLIRRLAIQNKDRYKAVFGNTHKLPTLTQFIPELFYFEDVGGDLFCSAYSGIPLVRYDLKDHGGVLRLGEIRSKLATVGIDLDTEIDKAGLRSSVWNLPFVYVYERSDLSVSYYAFNIYPETVRNVLIRPEFHELVTSRFSMRVDEDEVKNQILEINVELKADVHESPEIVNKIKVAVFDQLLEDSSEYQETYQMMGKKVEPKIILWKHRDQKYFNPVIKQQWVIKEKK